MSAFSIKKIKYCVFGKLTYKEQKSKLQKQWAQVENRGDSTADAD